MKIQIFQVDAFADRLFGGSPAAVCPLQQWLPKSLMQKIGNENNLSETAFFVPIEDGFDLKWFTPAKEVDLCGHATLASAFVLFELFGYPKNEICFQSNSGRLTVIKDNGWLTLNFPLLKMERIETPDILSKALDANIVETFKGAFDYLAILSNEEEVRLLKPDFKSLMQLPDRGVIVSARGSETDFVSRYFAPNYGIDEDPATGSSHIMLTPYWTDKLNKKELVARQLSARVGNLKCKLAGDRVEISGQAQLYMKGEIEVEV